MSTPHLASELDSAAGSVNSSPRSEHHAGSHDLHARVRFMCSFGGKILPRPHDNQLRYVGGDTRIVAIHRSTTFSGFIAKLSKLSGISNLNVKYQLPNEDLDALISVTTDEDVENMMDEYDRVAQSQIPRSARLRLFLFSTGDDSRNSSISSLLNGSANRENWFVDALNGGGSASGPGLERVRSEVSSIISEVPDYLLFGLDNSDENPKSKTRTLLSENVSMSDPGSPAPVISSPFCSTSSVPIIPSMPDLPPVKTKPDNPEPAIDPKLSQTGEFMEQPVSQQTGYSGSPMWHYVPESHYSAPAPVQQIPAQYYYVQRPPPPGTGPIQPVQMQPQYVQHYPGQIPLGYSQPVPGMGQVYMRSVPMDPGMGQDPKLRVVQDSGNQQVYYGVRNGNPMAMYPGMNMMVPGGEESGRGGSEANPGRNFQSG